MNKLNSIIKELQNVLKENKVEVTGNCLFENAVKIYISNNINESINIKKLPKLPLQINRYYDNEGKIHKEPIEIEYPLNNENPNAPTDKQIKFLKRNKIDTTNKTKQECTQIIKEIIEKEGRGDGSKNKWS